MSDLRKEEKVPSEILLFSTGFLRTVLLFVVIVILSRLFFFQLFFVDGQSMESTFRDRELLISEKVSYYFSEPQRFEAVLLRNPYYPKETLMKRIIGLPNEKITIRNGAVFVFNDTHPDGIKLEETYRQNAFTTKDAIELELGEKEYFVIGDNNLHSLDSRKFGAVNRNMILGRIFLRVAPFERMKIF